jgi:hypothetical protein
MGKRVNPEYLAWLEQQSPEVKQQELKNPDVVAATKQAKSKPGFWESVGLGGVQGATAGFADEINGRIQATGNAMSSEFKMPWGQTIHPGTGVSDAGYVEERDRFRAENDAAQKAHPVAYGGGELIAALPSTIATGGSGGIAKTALLSGAQGAVSAAGQSKADLTEGEYGDFAADVSIGGGLGMGLGALGEKISSGIKGAKDYFKNKSTLKHFQAAHPTLKDLKLVGGEDGAMAIGNRLRDEGVVGWTSNADNIADNIAPKLKETAGQLDAGYNALEGAAVKKNKRIKIAKMQEEVRADVLPKWKESAYKQGKNTAETTIDELGLPFAEPKANPQLDTLVAQRDAIDAQIKQASLAQKFGIKGGDAPDELVAQAAQLDKQIKEIKPADELSWANFRREKSAIGDVAGYDKVTDPLNSVAKQDVYGGMTRFAEKHAQDIDPDIAKQIKDANLRYSQLSDAKKIAVEQALKEAREAGLDVKDLMLVLGGGVLGAGAAVGKHLSKGRTAAMSAKSLDVLSALTGTAASATRGAANSTRAAVDTNDPNKKKKRKKRDYIDEY